MKKCSCILACMSVQAVHIELAESLDVDSFINAMRRFINQRGHPALIVLDSGTNFKGANNELEIETSKLDQSQNDSSENSMVIQSTLFTPHERVVGKKDWNSQGMYVCYYQGLNLNWFSDVDLFSETENIVQTIFCWPTWAKIMKTYKHWRLIIF